MAFYASSFQYDGIQSDIYNLYISEIDGSGESTTSGSSNMDIVNQKIFRRQFPYQYGMSISEVLSFPVEITSPNEIDAEVGAIIQRWLFSNRTFKRL